MNTFQVQTSFGTFVLNCSLEGKIIKNEWFSTVFLKNKQAKLWVSSEKENSISSKIQDILSRLLCYFNNGMPLGGEDILDWVETRQWSAFQNKVYSTLLKIPHGETRTYSWVAARLGSPQATRAVGQALRWNPIPILIPCHRIVSANDLGGFMGRLECDQPELQLKKQLLGLEQAYVNPVFPFLS